MKTKRDDMLVTLRAAHDQKGAWVRDYVHDRSFKSLGQEMLDLQSKDDDFSRLALFGLITGVLTDLEKGE